MGPMCFDYGFGPFRWVCTSCDPADLEITDKIALDVLSEMADAIPIVEDFEGVVLFKGSRKNKLEKLLPTWAVEEVNIRNDEKC